LLTGQATATQVNFYGFAAISALVGLFSSETAENLRTVFSTVFAPALAGRDRLAGEVMAVALRVEPEAGTAGTTVTITGRSLSGTTDVLFRGASASATVVSDTEVTTQVPIGASTGRIRLVLGDKIVSMPDVFRVE
jgi:hypothetical protein